METRQRTSSCSATAAGLSTNHDIAHLFSGHRREHDLQSFLEKISFGSHNLVVLSVDIVFSEQLGNLARPEVFARFREAIILGLLVAAGCGPPCETWSRARLHGAQDGGPMILRDAVSLHGLPQLRLGQFEQLMTGNLLLGIAVMLACLALVHGAFFFLEHPQCPPEEHAASIYGDYLCYSSFCCKRMLHFSISGRANLGRRARSPRPF